MAKGYWVIAWKSIKDAEALARYVALAEHAIPAHGGRVVAGGEPVRTYESALKSRTFVVEFDSVEAAITAYESADYQAAVAHLAGNAERDVRVIEGQG